MKFMKILPLLKFLELKQPVLLEEVNSVHVDSRLVKPGSLFVAIRGNEHDGHQCLREAVAKGASALLVEDVSKVPKTFQGGVFETDNTRKILSKVLNALYDSPMKNFFRIGVTGTNGKTTTVYLIEHILNVSGWKTGVIGTIDQHCGRESWPALLTTPEPLDLFERLEDFSKLDAKALIMEVSSIGIEQYRLDGVRFNVAGFTNLTIDHLDYHGGMDQYFLSKSRLFLELMDEDNHQVSILNRDDPYGGKLIQSIRTACLTYGKGSGDFCFQILKQSFQGIEMAVDSPEGKIHFTLPLVGEYNAYNATLALACGVATGFSLEDCTSAIESFPGVPGRFERVTPQSHPFQVFVDYAHTPLALRSVLRVARNFHSSSGRLTVIYGCGGDRDREKRSQMTKVALECSDSAWLTSDNPRNEDPEKIIHEASKNFINSKKLFIEVDRREAIEKALDQTRKGDLVLISGKGHEKYQIIGNRRIPFDDVRVVKDFLGL